MKIAAVAVTVMIGVLAHGFYECARAIEEGSCSL